MLYEYGKRTRDFFEEFLFFLKFSLLFFGGVFNKTIERLSLTFKRQTAKMKLLPSVFSSLYSRIKIFVFAVNSKRHFSIFLSLI